VVVPTFNERENLRSLVSAVLDQGDEFQLLVVDDGSPDGTGDLADELAADQQRVSVLHRPRKAGLGPAYIAGLSSGLADGFDFLITMDGDHSHNPADLPRLLAATRDRGADVAIGSRWARGGGTSGWPLARRVLSKGGSAYARFVLGLHIRDVTGGFKCLRHDALAALEITTIGSSGYAFNIELTYRAVLRGCVIEEVPIMFTERVNGVSKMSGRIVVEALLRVPALRATSLQRIPVAQPSVEVRL
jgi:dolichol-phosphate mannosyltransferase